MRITHLAILSLFILLTGCASVNDYQEPSSGKQSLATVSGSSVSDGFFSWRNTIVSTIDDKKVGMVWSENSKINVTPGKHLFVTFTNFNDGFNSPGPYNSINEIKMRVRSGVDYHFVGKVQGSSVLVWAENSHGQRVSQISSSKYEVSPKTYVLYSGVPND